jgi:hypothetical protein
LPVKQAGATVSLICEAIATALAWRTQQVITTPPDFEADPDLGTKLLNDRMNEFTSLYELVRLADARTFSIFYTEACHRIGRLTPM